MTLHSSREKIMTIADIVRNFNEKESIKKLIHTLTQNSQQLGMNIPVAQEYSDFLNIKNHINLILDDVFKDLLKNKSKDFQLGFEQGNISQYITQHNRDKIELIELLALKNKFYIQILRNITERGVLDMILSPEEKDDILNMIDSGIFSFLDDIYINWYQEIYNGKNDGITNSTLAYGGVKGGKIVPLKELSNKPIVIDIEKLSKIHNPHMRNYFLKFATLVCEGVTDYQTWVDAEIHEVKSWQERNSIFGFVGPMEDYIYQGVLVEPELLVCFRNKENTIDLEDFPSLSEKYYGEKYGMDDMTFDIVESLLHTGGATFEPFLGKAFPNDNMLSQKQGNCIILRDSRMRLVVKNSQKQLKTLLGPNFTYDAEHLYEELLKEVGYHEFGHSLFVKGHDSSLLEELKATLFYYLKLWDENTKKTFHPSDIKRIIEFALMDSIRNLERINETSSEKYVILTKVILSVLFKTGLLYWEKNLLVIQPNTNAFKIFLSKLKDILTTIQIFYTLDEEKRQEKENFFLAIIEESLKYDLPKMIETIKKSNA